MRARQCLPSALRLGKGMDQFEMLSEQVAVLTENTKAIIKEMVQLRQDLERAKEALERIASMGPASPGDKKHEIASQALQGIS